MCIREKEREGKGEGEKRSLKELACVIVGAGQSYSAGQAAHWEPREELMLQHVS